ncbi:leucine-rich repeat domain-containing protein [Aporhodopirellula aestuarii]|uniref:Protein kinase n=1 Tax=Aporhodopirellula aestuarii TaxID=2950107 RepID=A0ABT0U8Y4_9BACT|nr:protein kinase [Aporhodopirellula aestuarii]MCM2373370.1 protein kinase [Aporhodopirellula aestuarii]
MNDQVGRRRTAVNCVLFSSLAVILLMTLNLPCEYVRVLSSREGRISDTSISGVSGGAGSVEHAGWPFDYRVQLLASNKQPIGPPLYTSYWGIVGNVLFGVLTVVLISGYTWRRYHKIRLAQNSKKVRMRYDAMTAGGALLIPLTLFLISAATAAWHRRIAFHATYYGRCSMTAELPKWMATRIPKPLFPAFLRLRDVEVFQPSASLTNKLLSLPTLRELRFIAKDLDEKDLARLTRARELTEIVMESCTLSPGAMELLANHSQLRKIAIRRSVLSKSDLQNLNRLCNLERVDFSRSSFDFADFRQFGWASTVKSMRLPTPGGDNRERLSLENWNALEELTLERTRRRAPDATVELHLEACPRLKTIYLPGPQRYSLHGNALPALENIFEALDLPFGSPHDSSAVLLPRWEDLELNNVPRLTRIECNASDLNKLRVGGAKRLHDIVIGRSLYVRRHHEEYEPIEYPQTLDWIKAIGRLPDVRSLSMDRVRLTEREIALISKLDSLEQLSLTNSGLTADQLAPLAKMQSLKELDLHQCELDHQLLKRFLELPKLARITAGLSNINQLHLNNHQRITSISTLPLKNLVSLKMRNLPRFSGTVVVQNDLQKMVVSNVPGITELTVECPWPEDARLEKVDGLSRFAAGGRNLDDRVVRQLVDCDELDQLVLAYTSVSQDGLRRLGKLKTLTALEVPGSDVDDDVTSSWVNLERLRRICLDDTHVSEQTTQWFRTLASLRSLSLNRVDLSRAAWENISALSQLSELSLVGTSMPLGLLNRLVRHGGLEVLDISGHEIDDELIDAIVRSRYLHTIIMKNCQFELEQLQLLLTEHRQTTLVMSLSQEELDKLSPELQARIDTNSLANRRDRNSRQSHRVTILSKEFNPIVGTETVVRRPFAVERFRDPGHVAEPTEHALLEAI